MDNYEYFISNTFEDFVGQWIVIDNDKVIVHGNNFKKVYFEAKEKLKGKRPFITKVRSSITKFL